MSNFDVKILADSISEEGKRITTFQLRFWRPLLSEINTHRCLVGDTVLQFDMPAGYKKGGKKIISMTLKEFWDKWENGAAEGKVPSFKEYDLTKLNPEDFYTSKDIENIFGLNHSVVNNACKTKKIDAFKAEDGRTWLFKGQAFIDYRINMGKRRFSIRNRLANMWLRSYDSIYGTPAHTTVTDCWKVGEEPVFTVTAGSYSITGTKDHPLYTRKGWKEIQDLTTEDELLVQCKGTGKQESDPYKQINGTWVNTWCNQVRKEVITRQNDVCHECGQHCDSYDIHHVIPKHKRPDLAFNIDNVIAVCPECHKKLHAKQGWQKGAPLAMKYVKIDQIESAGIQPVYDIAVSSEEHNFIANGVVAHNCFSRNASSSRAQSFDKRINQVLNDTALPKHWNAEQPGMTGGEEFDPEVKAFINESINTLAHKVVDHVKLLNEVIKQRTGYEIHKQYLNRYLEPFTYTDQVLTSTDWDNFFKLRMAEDAQPEFKDLATEIFYQLQENAPVLTGLHLPYVTEDEKKQYPLDICKKISVARCARVSYRPYTGKYILEKDLELFNRLWASGHLSPFEHIAEADSGRFFNLTGWRSYRYDLEHSNGLPAGSI